MGFFGTFVYDGNYWYSVDPDKVPPGRLSPPFLWLDIHDSDLATLSYAPQEPGTGIAFLGYTPRTYFEDPNASAPTDTVAEAAGLAAWVRATVGQVEPSGEQIQEWLAADQVPDETEDFDDDEPFVEIKAAKFLAFLGVPVPDGLPH